MQRTTSTLDEDGMPATPEIARMLPSRTLYRLEVAGEIARDVLDERVIAWTGDGWSQRKIAEEVGCTQSAVSKRQARLGIKSRALRAGGQTLESVEGLGRGPVTSTGSTGQRVVNPVVVEARLGRLAVSRLLGAIGWPDADEVPRTSASMRG
jgi:hypothetical protein